MNSFSQKFNNIKTSFFVNLRTTSGELKIIATLAIVLLTVVIFSGLTKPKNVNVVFKETSDYVISYNEQTRVYDVELKNYKPEDQERINAEINGILEEATGGNTDNSYNNRANFHYPGVYTGKTPEYFENPYESFTDEEIEAYLEQYERQQDAFLNGPDGYHE